MTSEDFAAFLTDANGRITSWDPGVEHLLGYREDEWIGQPLAVIFTPEDRARGVPEFPLAEAAREGRAMDLRWYERKDGTRINVESTVVALQNEANGLLGFAWVMRGVTEHAEVDERLALALEAAGAVGTWDWNVKKDLVYCSERFASLFSINPSRAPHGVPLGEFLAAMHPDDRDSTEQKIRRALETGGPYTADFRVLLPDSSARWLHALGRVYHDARGKPSRFPGTMVDITELKEMERALRRSEEFNRRILESTRDCIKVLDLEGRILSINERGQQQLGIEDCAPFLHRPWVDFWEEPADKTAAEVALARSRDGLDGQFEGFFQTLRGEPRWWDVRVTPIADADGRTEKILVVSRDITERKRSEEALKRARDQAQVILESIADGFFVLDREWRFTYANPAAERLLENSEEDLLGKSHWELYPATVGTDGERLYRRAVIEQKPVEFEYFYEPWQRWYAIKAAPTQEGGLSVFFRDITSQKKADEELRRQWQTFDTVLSHTPDFICTFDLEGRFTYANAAVLSLFRMPLDELKGKSFLELNYPVELAERLNRQIRQVVETKQPLRDHTPFTAPDGESRELEYIFVPVLGAEGRVEAIADSTRDVTERIRAEERERQREAQLRDSARLESLGIMAGGIAHDFNNLLVGVLGNASLLAESGSEADRTVAAEIVLAAERAAELTKQMLAYSGKGHFAVETLDLNRLIRENLALLRASLSKSVSVELTFGAEACLVEADPTQIQQVVMNLLINASEAIGEAPGTVAVRTGVEVRGEPRFSPHLHAEVKAGRYALLEIRDSGAGMSAETVKKIFDPFFTTKFTGRGLGLAAVLGIVRGHRGDIDVESAPGAGTAFRVFLPASDRAEAGTRKTDHGAAVRASGQTVLVVDDEDIVRRTATAALEKRGFHVIQASNGREALEALSSRGDIAVVVLDLTMPVMTGEQALPAIQAMYPGIPIVLSSGYGEAEILRRFALSDIAGVLQKPYTVSEIVARVKRALEERR